jgi:hypothetical protein
MKYSSLILVIALVACGSSNGDEMHDAMNSDAGTSPSSDDGGASESASKIDKITEPKTDSMRTTLEDAGTQADAGSEQQPAADAGPSEGMGGSGAAGAPAVEGQAGAPASAGHDAAGAGGMGGSAAGAGGAAGSSSSSACPGGDTDADANGYPDACESVLWSAEGSSSSPLDLAGFKYNSAGMIGFLTIGAGDSVHCPELNGTGIASLGHATPFAAGHPASSQIVDAQSDVAARALATCFERDNAVPIALEGYVADKSAVDTSGYARVLYDAQPFRNHLNAGAPTVPPAIAGKHILYFRITMKHLSVTSYDGTLGTTVQAFDATIEAIGY